MPDGFTPVSLSLFDNQVSLIVRDYSLKGINVLVHCRGESFAFAPEHLVDHFFSRLPVSSLASNCIVQSHPDIPLTFHTTGHFAIHPLVKSTRQIHSSNTQHQSRHALLQPTGGVGRAGLTASAWAIKMGFVPPHPSLSLIEEAANRQAHEKAQQDQAGQAHTGGLPGLHDQAPQVQVNPEIPAELEHQIVMSIVERVIAMIRSRRGLKAIESFEQVQFLASYVKWSRATSRGVSSK